MVGGGGGRSRVAAGEDEAGIATHRDVGIGGGRVGVELNVAQEANSDRRVAGAGGVVEDEVQGVTMIQRPGR